MTPVSGNGRKRAVLYARVSTDDQADRGYSLPSQLDLCRQYAERNGFALAGNQYFDLKEGKVVPGLTDYAIPAYVDDYSGMPPIAERPEGKKVAALLGARQADAVIVYQVDRLSRDIVDLLATVRGWLRAGVEVHTCDIGKVESELDIVLVIKGWQGSDERKKIRERTMRGRNAKAQSGKVVGNGYAPYGYRFEYLTVKANARAVVVGIVVEEGEARIVRLIYHWYVFGDESGKPLTEIGITRKLSEMRVPTPGENRGGMRRKRGAGLWSKATVHKILASETYLGQWHYGKRIAAHGNGGKRERDEQIAVKVPAMIDADLWEKARERREYNRWMSKRNTKHEYLLRGLVRCGNCGYRMRGKYSGRNAEHLYYECPNSMHHFAGLEDVCREKAVSGQRLEAFVWDFVIGLFSDPQQFEWALHKAQKARLATFAPKQERLQTVIGLIKDCETGAAKLADALAKVSSGVVGRALEVQIEETEARYTALTNERDALQAELSDKHLADENIQAAMILRDTIVEGMGDPDFESKRRVFELLQVSVVVKDRIATVECIIPSKTATANLTASSRGAIAPTIS